MSRSAPQCPVLSAHARLPDLAAGGVPAQTRRDSPVVIKLLEERYAWFMVNQVCSTGKFGFQVCLKTRNEDTRRINPN